MWDLVKRAVMGTDCTPSMYASTKGLVVGTNSCIALVPSSKEEPERLFTELSQDGTVLMPMANGRRCRQDSIPRSLHDPDLNVTSHSANLTRRRCTEPSEPILAHQLAPSSKVFDLQVLTRVLPWCPPPRRNRNDSLPN
jgi:hypothetical protein